MTDRMIQGLQVQLIIGGNFDKEEVLALLDSSEAYIVASIDGVEEFRIPVSNMPAVSSEWYDLGPRPLPLSKTRFSLPAFISLRYKMAQISKTLPCGCPGPDPNCHLTTCAKRAAGA